MKTNQIILAGKRAPVKNRKRLTILIEENETKEQAIKRAQKYYNISDAELEEYIINLLNVTE